MCTRPKKWKYKDYCRMLQRNGYKRVGQRGDHIKYSNGKRILVVTPNLNKVVALRLIKEYELNTEV